MNKPTFYPSIFFIVCFTMLWTAWNTVDVLAQGYEKVEKYYDATKKVKQEVFWVKKTKSKIVRDSSYTSYYQNGNLKSKGQFKNNQPAGYWQYYYEYGGLKASGSFVDGQNQGTWTYYYENGNRSASGKYEHGIKSGTWTNFFESKPDLIKSEGAYLENKREGIWKFYDEQGLFKAQADFKQDKGMYTEYYEGGAKKSEGLLVEGKSVGVWKYYHDNGQLMGEGEERNGLKEGQWVFYDKQGVLTSKGVYQQGKQFGAWFYYHPNGALASSGEYQEDMKEGEWTTFNTAGKKIGQGNFKSGSGIYREYYESGKLKIEGPVEKDKNEGQWTYYYETGEKEGTCFYTQGKGKYIGYYKDGVRKMEGLLENGYKTGIWRLYKPNGELAGLYKTYYEKDAPVFEPMEEDSVVVIKKDTLPPVEKPQLKLPKKRSRYFTPRVNEFRSYIVGGNPIALLRNAFPVSIEMYYQERIGYELGLVYVSKPMFRSHANTKINELYYVGYQVYLRQKFYQKDQDYGMLYFAHELRYTSTSYGSEIIDTLYTPAQEAKLALKENTFEYSILFGDRLMKDSRKKGFTLDIFVGIGIGYRVQTKDWPEDNKQYKSTFSSVSGAVIKVPFRLGFTLGYVFPRAH
jgi:uncharacterized protein